MRWALPTREAFNAAWNAALEPLHLVPVTTTDVAGSPIEGMIWKMEEWWEYIATTPCFADTMSRVVFIYKTIKLFT